jgi:glycosyltransferase involved in cell wall biosynthesis
MRIAEVNDIASVASELARGLRDRGHDVTVIQPRLFGGGLHWAVKPVVSPVRLLEWTRLVRRLRAEQYDLIHIHYAYLGMVGVLGKFPYLLHCHGSDIWQITPFTRYITSRALKNAGHVFYATPDLAAVLDQRPDAEFLPNPIDTEAFRALSPASDSTAVYIACALDDLKGAPALLEACRILAAQRPDIRLTAIAGGKYTPDFEALPNVGLLPRQARSDLPAVISRHGIVVGQTNLGAAGMAELESMSCARPVVCHFTFGGAYPEPPPFVAGKTGPEIAAAVIRLVDDPALRARTGGEGRAWIERHHDLRRITERVERAAFDLLQQPRAAPCPVES